MIIKINDLCSFGRYNIKQKTYLKTVKLIKCNRSYDLKLHGSQSKFEDLKWAAYQYSKFTNAFINHLYFNESKGYSTKGLGLIGNSSQQKALGIVKSKKSNEKDNGHKKSAPFYSVQTCCAKITKQTSLSHYNYRINFSHSFTGDKKAKPRHLFAKGISPLKKALNRGWILSHHCELFFEPKDNHWYVRVFVSREVKRALPNVKSIGIDVGVNHLISTSEKYLGNSFSKRLKKTNNSREEKNRQLSLAKNRKDEALVSSLSKNLTKNKQIKKTVIKQLLDKEAKKVIARGLSTSSNLVVEDPNVLANLKGSKGLRRWARTYFVRRLQVLGKENGVFVVFTNPAYTSQTCNACGEKDAKNRDGVKFHCTKCGHKDHADLNAAKNLARKGQEQVDKYIKPKLSKFIANPVRALK